MKSVYLALGTLAAAVVLLAGCGSDADSKDTKTEPHATQESSSSIFVAEDAGTKITIDFNAAKPDDPNLDKINNGRSAAGEKTLEWVAAEIDNTDGDEEFFVDTVSPAVVLKSGSSFQSYNVESAIPDGASDEGYDGSDALNISILPGAKGKAYFGFENAPDVQDIKRVFFQAQFGPTFEAQRQ